MCRHEQQQLIGTKDGFFCPACGRTFPTWEKLEADRKKSDEKPKKARAKKQ